MLRLENLFIVLGLLLVAIPSGFSLYAYCNQVEAISKWEKTVPARAAPANSAYSHSAGNDRVTGGGTKGLIEKPSTQGESIALLDIPAIEKKYDIIEGATWANLAKGPGRVSTSALIGAAGTTIISGHRTMYGAPFRNLDKLAGGDILRIVTEKAEFTYRVTDTKIVTPSDMRDVTKTGKSRLILSTCEPAFSAKYRLLKVCELEGARALTYSNFPDEVSKR